MPLPWSPAPDLPPVSLTHGMPLSLFPAGGKREWWWFWGLATGRRAGQPVRGTNDSQSGLMCQKKLKIFLTTLSQSGPGFVSVFDLTATICTHELVKY